MSRTWIVLSVLSFWSCAGGTEEHRAASGDAIEVDQTALASCTAGFTRARECTDRYIPALVDLRVRLDVPAGIAAHDREVGRPALVEQAMQEWSTDSTDTGIEATCEKMAAAPPEKLHAFFDAADDCLEAADCQAYVDCVMPLHERMFAAK